MTVVDVMVKERVLCSLFGAGFAVHCVHVVLCTSGLNKLVPH